MADITYNNHTEDTSFGSSDYLPMWKTSSARAGKINLANLISSLASANNRVTSTASAATHTPNAATTDVYVITAQAVNTSFLTPSGSPQQGQRLLVRIKDNGAARTMSWASVYRGIGQSLPSTTIISKLLYIGFMYNSTDSKWDMVALAQET